MRRTRVRTASSPPPVAASLVAIGKSLGRLCGTVAMVAITLPLVSLWGLGTRGGDIWPR